MSENIINKVIRESYKINYNESLEDFLYNTERKNIDDNSFNKLLSLQLLIQKHSGLKELCKNY